MSTSVNNILWQSRPHKKLNILTFDTHERYQTNMAKTGHNFYSYRVNDGDAPFRIKKWNEQYGKIPENYTIFDADLKENQIPGHINFDLILSQNKFGQFQIAHQIARQLHLPLLSLEHTLPMPYWNREQIESTIKMRGHVNVFISDYSRQKWEFGEADVIHHGIDTSVFKDLGLQRENKSLSVVNDFINRDIPCGFKLWAQTIGILDSNPNNIIEYSIWGDTPGLSSPTKDINHLVELYNTHSIFLNTSQISPIPTVLMEAMSCGCAVVSTNNCMIPEIISHGVNGLLGNTADELRNHIKTLQNDEGLRKELGKNARKTIVDNFSLDLFVENWNKVLEKCARIPYLGEYHV